MTPGDLAMYALYIGIFISPIQILVELTEMMQKGLSGFRGSWILLRQNLRSWICRVQNRSPIRTAAFLIRM